MPRITGDYLKRKWNIPAKQVRFRETGNFFMPLEEFPGVLADLNGYVLFETREKYEQCSKLRHGESQSNPRVLVIPSRRWRIRLSQLYQNVKALN